MNSMTGFRIGCGNIFARLYDKGLEIKTKSKKFWMFDLWKLESIPEGFKAIQGSQLQLIRQVYGLMTSLTALQQEHAGQGLDEMADFSDCLASLFENFRLLEDKENFSDKVFQKRTKFNRTKQQQTLVNKLRDGFDEFLERRKGWAHAS